MGRELKRVSLNFNWPIDMVWKGYINPYRSMECKVCGSSGYNEATKKISDDWYSFNKTKWIETKNGRYNDLAWSNHITEVEIEALLKANRLQDFTSDNGYIPTPEEVNKWNREGMGHDSLNQMICVRARAEYLGVYGLCQYCNGEGRIWPSKKIKELAENWEPFDPPKGKGFQLWETTSEGSPISPVFKTLDELSIWCAKNATTFGSHKATKEEWLIMLKEEMIFHKIGNTIFI